MYDFIIFEKDDDGNNIAGQCETVELGCAKDSTKLKNVIIKAARFRKLTAEKNENRFYPEMILSNAHFALFKRPETEVKEAKTVQGEVV